MISAHTARRRPVSGFLYQAQTTEVHLRHLAWCALLHPHRRGASSLPTPPTDDTSQHRRVRVPRIHDAAPQLVATSANSDRRHFRSSFSET